MEVVEPGASFNPFRVGSLTLCRSSMTGVNTLAVPIFRDDDILAAVITAELSLGKVLRPTHGRACRTSSANVA